MLNVTSLRRRRRRRLLREKNVARPAWLLTAKAAVAPRVRAAVT
jgi:hypothetical protein